MQVDNNIKDINKFIVSKKKTKKELSEHMRKIGSMGGKKTASKGKEYMSCIGKRGQQALVKKVSSK